MSTLYFTTPVATIKFAHLAKADAGPNGTWTPKFKVTLVLDPKDGAHAKFIESLNKANKEAHATLTKGSKKKPNLRSLTTEEYKDDEPTGKVEIKLSSKFMPQVVDTKGNDVPMDVIKTIGNGSTMAAKLTAQPATIAAQRTSGLCLYLNKLLLVNLEVFNSSSDGASGFGVDVGEDGYTYDGPQGSQAGDF